MMAVITASSVPSAPLASFTCSQPGGLRSTAGRGRRGMVRAWRAGHYGRMFLLLLAALGCLGLLFVLALRYSDAVNAALGAVPDWLRRRAWGVLLVPLALLYALISANGYVGAAE